MLVGAVASGADERAAIREYLTPVVAEFSQDRNGAWLWEHNSNGGYLVRLSMDVTGDGRGEMFVTSTLTSVKDVGEWKVFDVTEKGEWRPYSATIRFATDSAWPSKVGDASSLLKIGAPNQEKLRVGDERPFPVRRSAFAFPAITDSWTYASESEVAALTPSDPAALPKLEAILLVDYLLDPEAKWSAVKDWKIDGSDHFFRVEDLEKVPKHRDFTPAVAMTRLNRERESERGKGDDPAGQSPARKGGQGSEVTGDRGSRGDGAARSWIGAAVAVLLAVGAIGVVWWQRRKDR